MGTWGTSILASDTARDVYDDYMKAFNRGQNHEGILGKIMKERQEEISDEDDGPVVWLAVAKAQWDCGALAPSVLREVERIVKEGPGLVRWEESGKRLLEQRKRKLAAFLQGIRTPNPKPRKPRRAVKRKPVFEPGDCLSIRLDDGTYGAAIVLAAPPESDDPFRDTYGMNVVCCLTYRSQQKPDMTVFDRRQWLRLTHHSWDGRLAILNVDALGFRKLKGDIERCGKTCLREDDPKEAIAYGGWGGLRVDIVEQDKWDRGERSPQKSHSPMNR